MTCAWRASGERPGSPGLAKAFEPEGLDTDQPESPTLSARATQAGVILGTAAYMSPEQARGRPVDKRADVWAFGAVLFEMLTGQRAFVGSDVTDTLASVLRREPDWGAVPATAPRVIHRLLRRTLAKVPQDRLRDIGDARLEPELEMGPPRVAFEAPDFVDSNGISFRVSSDGQRLYYVRRSHPPSRDRIHIVQNWFSELEELVPVKR